MLHPNTGHLGTHHSTATWEAHLFADGLCHLTEKQLSKAPWSVTPQSSGAGSQEGGRRVRNDGQKLRSRGEDETQEGGAWAGAPFFAGQLEAEGPAAAMLLGSQSVTGLCCSPEKKPEKTWDVAEWDSNTVTACLF